MTRKDSHGDPTETLPSERPSPRVVAGVVTILASLATVMQATETSFSWPPERETEARTGTSEGIGRGGGGGPEATLVNPVVPYDFGDQVVGAAPATVDFVIENTGAAVLEIAAIIKSGADCAHFVVTAIPPYSIPPSAWVSFGTDFDPAATGTLQCTLSVESNDPLGPLELPVSGVGLAPKLTVTPGTVSFEATLVGDVSATQEIVVANTGTSAMTVTNVSLDDSVNYEIVSPSTPRNVDAGSGFTIDVRFHPLTSGSRPATVTVATDNPIAPSFLGVELAGEGLAPPQLAFSPTELHIGNVTVGDTDSSDITFYSIGEATLTVNEVTISGSDASSFAIVGSTSFSILPDEGHTVTVSCTPETVGSKVSQLTVDSDSAVEVESPPVSCTGVRPLLAISPASELDIGRVRIDEIGSSDFTFSNTGSETLTVTDISFSTGEASVFAVIGSSGFQIAPSDDRTVTVSCSPTNVGVYTTVLVVDSDAQGEVAAPTVVCTGFEPLFADGFESGHTDAWPKVVPPGDREPSRPRR